MDCCFSVQQKKLRMFFSGKNYELSAFWQTRILSFEDTLENKSKTEWSFVLINRTKTDQNEFSSIVSPRSWANVQINLLCVQYAMCNVFNWRLFFDCFSHLLFIESTVIKSLTRTHNCKSIRWECHCHCQWFCHKCDVCLHTQASVFTFWSTEVQNGWKKCEFFKRMHVWCLRVWATTLFIVVDWMELVCL